MSLIELVKLLRNDGFKQNRARVKVCQEIFMTKLALSTFKDSGSLKAVQLCINCQRNLEEAQKMSI
jgi:hypothetical protein